MASVSSHKRSKVTSGTPSNVVSLSEPEEEDEEESSTYTARQSMRPLKLTGKPSPTVPVSVAGIVSNGLGGGRGSRGHTPPIVIDEAEMNRKVSARTRMCMHVGGWGLGGTRDFSCSNNNVFVMPDLDFSS